MKRTKPKGCYVGNEDQFQTSAMRLVTSIATSRGVPKNAIIHIPSGAVFAGDKTKRMIQASRLKAQGWKPGYPDIMVFDPKWGESTSWIGAEVEGVCGLAIELKVWPNKPTDEQVEVITTLSNAGWACHVCYGLDEVERIAREYFGAEPNKG